MAALAELSPAKCIILAASLAADSNIKALYQLTPARLDVFDLELLLRILLTFLPETLSPSEYVTYLNEITTRVYLEQQDEYHVDTAIVDKMSETEAAKELRTMKLLPLSHPSIQEDVINDPLILFLITRAHRIDSETSLMPLIHELLEPFLGRSMYLRNWYISAILPLLRLDFEYYPDQGPATSLAEFERLAGESGVQRILSKTDKSARKREATQETLGRDFRGILGPWVHGGMWRKKRKLSQDGPPSSLPIGQTLDQQSSDRSGRPDYADKLEDWQPVFKWIVTRAINDFRTATHIVEGWGGPFDVDLGGYQKGWRLEERDEDLGNELTKQYCQSAFSCIYACEEDSREVVDLAHGVLVRLARLLDFEPPPNLATSIHNLPKVQRHSSELEGASPDYLRYDVLLEPENPLTKPIVETFSLLQMLVYSAYQLIGLNYGISVAKVAKLRFFSDGTEQLSIVHRILHGLEHGSIKGEEQWEYFRDTLLWLWDWAIADQPENDKDGYGVFGKVKCNLIEKEILESMCRVGHFSLASKIYLDNTTSQSLPRDEVEKIVVGVILHYFDNASNGNRNRGGAKKASDLLSAFRSYFPQSPAFRQCSALLAAAHALSFYSLTLQRGIPFQPVSIRVNDEPLSLIEKVLVQNSKSYTKLDDLIEIGRNITIAHMDDLSSSLSTISTPLSPSVASEATQLRNAERQVTGMAITAALKEDDFETAYSYVVNRLTPPVPTPFASTATPAPTNTLNLTTNPTIDDISWRAALSAGRHRSPLPNPSLPAPKSVNTTTPPHLRRLEQRMELLSQSLLLAPPPALPEVLAAWRRCEEELLTVLATESAAAHEFDSQADTHGRVDSGMTVPGTFGGAGGVGDLSIEPRFAVQPRRKEHGRGAKEEAPMGLFDVARGAAAALGRTTGGLDGLGKIAGRVGVGAGMLQQQALHAQGQAQQAWGAHAHVQDGAEAGDAASRVRKRDMVANAVVGGIGWVLGATPVGGQGSRPPSR